MRRLLYRTLAHRTHWRLAVSLLWEPRDIWVGVYWKRRSKLEDLQLRGWAVDEDDEAEFERETESLDIYVCLVPLLPIRNQLAEALPGGRAHADGHHRPSGLGSPPIGRLGAARRARHGGWSTVAGFPKLGRPGFGLSRLVSIVSELAKGPRPGNWARP